MRNHERRRAARGFTMVELLVALTAGLLVSSSAYLLARNSMKSYQDESRIASSQVSVSVGLNRIQSELQRAAYMSSPNTAADTSLCGLMPGGVTLRGLKIFTKGSDLSADFNYETGLNPDLSEPDLVVVTGNMTSTEQLEYRVIEDTADGTKVHMAMDRGPMQRLIQGLGQNVQAVRAVFVPLDGVDVVNPRFARIIDQSGKASYVRVEDADVVRVGPEIVAVTLFITDAAGDPVTDLRVGTECGFLNRGGGLINPVSVIRYRVGRPTMDTYSLATDPLGAVSVTGEDLRTELLREEISPEAMATQTDTTLTVEADKLSSQEIAAEFAVALEFSAYERTGTTLTFRDFTADAAIDAITPQNFRALGVRLATRARVPDREDKGPDGIVSRFGLSSVGARQKYARMRTLQTQVQLPNLAGVSF